MDGDGPLSIAARQARPADAVVARAEWAPHRAMWLGFPARRALWGGRLEAAQAEVAALALTLAQVGGEQVRLLAHGAAAAAAEELLAGCAGVEIVPLQAGDVWLRDTGPVFLGGRRAAVFSFNGWGGKYRLHGDRTLARRIALAAGAAAVTHRFVLEGGAVELDGEGTALATRQCLLNPNRNLAWSAAIAEAALGKSLGIRKLVWLGQGLANDHTDGHVDNLARFVAPGRVAVGGAAGADDPNAEVYARAAAALEAATDAIGRPLRVTRVPSPGRTTSEEGALRPASHMNFIIANKAVIVPLYDAARGAPALDALAGLFPGRAVIGLPSGALLAGGGSFHCISQPEPAA